RLSSGEPCRGVRDLQTAASQVNGRDDRLAARHLPGGEGQLAARGEMPGASLVERLTPDDPAVVNERDEQPSVVAVVLRRRADADHLGLGYSVGRSTPQGELATADRDLVDALLRDR